ncbi:uncharacterized protein LOC129984786 isoform X2 [Argiope bruennichi]|nr:uncharacterized protein LOC129984786 isoform X2 [Argiope bruennichi]
MKEVLCPQTWETFLSESADLQEHNRVLQSGRSGSTNIEGKSLQEILHEYHCLKDAAENRVRNTSNSRLARLNGSHSVAISSKRFRIKPYSKNILTPQKISLHRRHLRLQNNMAMNRFTRSETAIRFAESGHLSPHSVQKYLSTPTRSYSFMVPDQQHIKCVTALNFDISIEGNEESTPIKSNSETTSSPP